MFEDTVINNPITSIYQKNSRIRSGKISMPLEADDSIQWILRAIKNNPKLDRLNIYVAPVAINYERLFDTSLFGEELVTGKNVDINVFQSLNKIY